ncbi:MAG: hypothetical protein ACRDK3_01710 [Actinomycetota bacterium]
MLQKLSSGSDGVLQETVDEVDDLAARYRFFHWHLEFPQIFEVGSASVSGADRNAGWSGGFSCVLGNPPWEHIELKEQEFFAANGSDISLASGAARKKLIANLSGTDPQLSAKYRDEKRRIDGLRHFAANSGRFPLTGRGRVKTDPLFAEGGRTLIARSGRLGMVIPTGIATDATTQYFFKDLVESASLASLFDFENARPLFAGVHRSYKFCLLTLNGPSIKEAAAEFAFFLLDPNELAKDDVRFELKPDEITLLNPNTGTCPIFRSRRDAEITLSIYRRVPVLIKKNDPDGNPWGLSFSQGLFNMTSDSHLFHTRDELEAEGWLLKGNVFERGNDRMLPLYEAKMIHHFDHRWATYDGDKIRDCTPAEKDDPNFSPLPRYWVSEKEVTARLEGRWNHKWLLGWRDICRSTDERTMLCSMFPRSAAPDGMLLMLPTDGSPLCLLSVLASFILDFREC